MWVSAFKQCSVDLHLCTRGAESPANFLRLHCLLLSNCQYHYLASVVTHTSASYLIL